MRNIYIYRVMNGWIVEDINPVRFSPVITGDAVKYVYQTIEELQRDLPLLLDKDVTEQTQGHCQ